MMVEKLWKSSLSAWILSSLGGLCERSIFNSILSRLTRAVRESLCGTLFNGVLTSPPYTRTWYDALLGWINRLLRSIMAVAERGITAAVLRAAGRGISRFTRGSVICGAIARFGMRRLLLTVFALFLPIDVFIRSAGLPGLITSLWDEALLGFMMLYALYDTAKGKGPPRTTPIDSPFILFIGLGIFLLLFVSPDMAIGIEGFRAVFQYMLFFPVLVRLIKNERDIRLMTSIFLGIGFIMALHGIYQYIIAAPIPSTWTSMSESGVRTRAFSIVGSPNILGDYMIMAAPIAVAMAYSSKKLKSKLFFWCCFGAICLCSLVTFSRGAWIGLVVAAVVFSLLVDKRLFILLFFAGLAALLIPEVSNRLGYLFTPAFQMSNESSGRSARWDYGLALLNKQGPLLGVGLGRFGGAVAMHNQVMPGVTYFYLDNYYMKTLVEMGYAGIVSYAALLLSSIWMGLRSFLRSGKGYPRLMMAALLASVCGVLSHSFFENIFEVPYMNAYFWAFAALLACCGFVWKRGENAARSS